MATQRYDVTRRCIVLIFLFTSFFTNVLAASLETPPFHLNRSKRDIYFRPLFVYKQQQQQQLHQHQRLKKIHEIYLQQQNTDQQHLEDYPIVLINNEFYQSIPLNQQLYEQQYDPEYYQQYYNKYFQTYPQAANNVL
ncbi:hypothetical protein Bhyg_13940 [Pseudolycoriella hygida]|uniref:Alpha-gliadin n=1 Tax=Pseudolycoriella hygida TaxID=35572 RepID=A0A9Q0MQK4_9DIPT|nr:hypothetical protein Bhyg_13940 [Pseudolycoriella hygida]